MGLENLLKKVDQGILNQFEKVTQHANKKLGWNKYDLVRLFTKAGGMVEVAASAYYLGSYALDYRFDGAVFGLFWAGLAYLELNFSPKIADNSEKLETKLLMETGATIPPQYYSQRPLIIMLTMLTEGVVGNKIYQLSHSALSLHKSPGELRGDISYDLALVSANVVIDLVMCASYFRSTTMTPPATKKNPLKVLYEKAKTALLPEPQKEPAAVPVSMPMSTNYQEIQPWD